MTVMSSSDPCISLVDLNELLPGGGSICSSSSPLHEQSTKHRDAPTEFAGAVLTPQHKPSSLPREVDGSWGGGSRGGGHPETGGNGHVARLDQDPRNPQRRVLRISFVFGSTDRKRKPGKLKASDFWATGGRTHLGKTTDTFSLTFWVGDGGNLFSFWSPSTPFP